MCPPCYNQVTGGVYAPIGGSRGEHRSPYQFIKGSSWEDYISREQPSYWREGDSFTGNDKEKPINIPDSMYWRYKGSVPASARGSAAFKWMLVFTPGDEVRLEAGERPPGKSDGDRSEKGSRTTGPLAPKDGTYQSSVPSGVMLCCPPSGSDASDR